MTRAALTEPELFDVPVDGGTLRVARWGQEGAPTAVAAHGITSSHVFWTLIGEKLAGHGLGLLAPDLRGRGDSDDPGERSSIAQHADDLIAVADHVGLADMVVAGHSMGGFVAAVCGVRHADRVRRVVLIDGGPALVPPLPPDADVEAVLHQVIGPSLERLDRTFADRQEYRDFWHAHPATAGIPGDLVDAYADYDLHPARGGWRSKVSRDVVLADARDTLVAAEVRNAVAALECPVTFLYAERGMLDGPQGLYTADRVTELVGHLDHVRTKLVSDTNHFTIGMGRGGAATVADAIAHAISASSLHRRS